MLGNKLNNLFGGKLLWFDSAGNFNVLLVPLKVGPVAALAQFHGSLRRRIRMHQRGLCSNHFGPDQFNGLCLGNVERREGRSQTGEGLVPLNIGTKTAEVCLEGLAFELTNQAGKAQQLKGFGQSDLV